MIITKRKINKSLFKIKIGQNEIIQKDSVEYRVEEYVRSVFIFFLQ